jgi:hypothetical protein
VEINYYSDGTKYGLENERVSKLIPKSYIDFSLYSADNNSQATLYQKEDSLDATSFGFITASAANTPISFECNISLPKDVDRQLPLQTEYSIFGCHSLENEIDATWKTSGDYAFNVYVIKDHNNVKFAVSSSMLSSVLTSSYFSDGYMNDDWTLNVQIYPQKDEIYGGSSDYYLKFCGVRVISQDLYDSFEVSSSISSATGSQFLLNNKNVFAGAHKTDMTGGLLMSSNIKLYSVRSFLEKNTLEEIKNRANDIENLGKNTKNSSFYKNYHIPQYNSVILDWTFDDLPYVDDGAGRYVQDCSFGSEKYGILNNILNKNLTGVIDGLDRKQWKKRDYKEIFQISHPNKCNGEYGININIFDDLEFSKDSIPKTNVFITVESSLYEKISQRMLNLINSRKEFSNFIAPFTAFSKNNQQLNKFNELFLKRRMKLLILIDF